MADIDMDALYDAKGRPTVRLLESRVRRARRQRDDARAEVRRLSAALGAMEAERDYWAGEYDDVSSRYDAACAERDSLARWKAEAQPVMSAFLDLARRVVPDSALGRFLPDALAEHVNRQAAALREVGAWATPETACAGCPPDGWDFDAWDVRLNAFAEVRAILARHSGGGSDG